MENKIDFTNVQNALETLKKSNSILTSPASGEGKRICHGKEQIWVKFDGVAVARDDNVFMKKGPLSRTFLFAIIYT